MRGLVLIVAALGVASRLNGADRPNIVLIGAEDISPNLGCYGDPDAITPNLDKLAGQGARFTRCFTHAPVCAPSRSGLITGVYPTTLGTHHMRSKLTKTPPLFVDYLRKAGYFVAWPGKTDFNFDLPKGWVDTRQDWTKKPDVLPKDKPWLAYINFNVTHESQARATPEKYQQNTARLKPEERRDRAKVKLPPYYPDTPAVRECVGKYHDNITAMDYAVGDVLRLLDERKWSDNTVVIFFGDHGAGLTRCKRWCYDSGTRVPLIVRGAGHKPGSTVERLVSFIDIAPTILDLAGVEIPPHMQGQVFLIGKNHVPVSGEGVELPPGLDGSPAKKAVPPRKYCFSARDRMDETFDRIRAVRGERYRYVRNFHPELPYAQYINYRDEMPIMKDWRRLAFEGKLNDVQKLFFARTKPKEELYDLETDPYEVKNLADAPEHQATLKEMRAALDQWIEQTKDLGEVPEKELIERGLVRDVLSTEYDARGKLHPKTPPVP